MAKVYSSWESSSGGTLSARIWFDYTILTSAETGNQYSISFKSGMDFKSTKALGEISPTARFTLAGTGQTTSIFGGTTTINIAKANTVYSCQITDVVVTWNWAKVKTSASKTVTLTETETNQKATKTFTIPAKTSYKVSYNANGGSGAPSAQTKWYGETLTLSSTKPTRSGYTFNGWNTNSSGTGTNYSSGASYTGNAALSLYAKWTANKAVIKYYANGGTQSASGASQYPMPWSHDYLYNNTINLGNISTFGLTKTGYRVITGQEWNTAANGSGTSYNHNTDYTWTTFGSTTAASKTTSLYANWVANTYSVIYNANGGSGTMSNSSHTYDIAKNLTSNTFTRTDYTFNGWAKTSTGAVAYTNGASVKNLTSTHNATVNLYAVWDYNYQDADISNVTVSRVDNNGALDDTGVRAKYIINIVPARTKNQQTNSYITTNVYLDYKLRSATSWTTLNSSNPLVITDETVLEGYFKNSSNTYITFDTEQIYDIRVRAEGVVSSAVKTSNASRTTFLSKAEFTVDISANGKCIGIFTPADDNLDNTILINGETYHSGKSVVGKYYNPVSNFSDYGFVVGNGTSESSRSNALTVDWNGFIQHRSLVMSSDSNVTAPSSNTTLASNSYYDINDHQIGYDQIVLNTGNNLYRSFAVTRQVNNATITHAMYMGIETSGDRYVSFSEPQAWRSGLGLKRGSSITRTYTSNSYVNQTNFNRLAAYQIGNLVYITGNLSLSTAMPKSSDWVTIGSFDITPNVTWYESVAGCGSGSNIPALGVQITTSGVIQIYNYSNTSAPSGAWYRFTAIIPIE